MHSDREKLVEHLRHRAETMNGAHPVGAGDGGTYACGYYTVADQKLDREAIAALSEPVKDESVAEEPFVYAIVGFHGRPVRFADTQAHAEAEARMDAERRIVPLYTRPAGERPAVAVTLGGKAIRGAQIATETQGLLRDPLQNYVTIEDAFAALSAINESTPDRGTPK